MTDFRFGNERVAGVAARPPAVRFGPPAPHRHHWLIRPQDLLVFDVGWVNLTLFPGKPADGKGAVSPAQEAARRGRGRGQAAAIPGMTR